MIGPDSARRLLRDTLTKLVPNDALKPTLSKSFFARAVDLYIDFQIEVSISPSQPQAPSWSGCFVPHCGPRVPPELYF